MGINGLGWYYWGMGWNWYRGALGTQEGGQICQSLSVQFVSEGIES